MYHLMLYLPELYETTMTTTLTNKWVDEYSSHYCYLLLYIVYIAYCLPTCILLVGSMWRMQNIP